ncbi:MAG: outer membrane protein assembly factor BamE domain-containing protein [Planctomycetota bacterium]|jgi:outer membrane protein assembly factor BamE (lipoprotein component of BamABCDE complex)
MGRKAAALVLVLAALGVGCAGHRPRGGLELGPAAEEGLASPVKVGMTAAEVQSILGTPLQKVQTGREGHREVWYYGSGVVILRDKRVAFNYAVPAFRG